MSAHIAELHSIRELVASARHVVAAGWVQNAWYVSRAEDGHRHAVIQLQRGDLGGGAIAKVCLIASVLHANGGVATAGTQLVQRTFDLIWHTLYGKEHEPVRWCPAPSFRTLQVRDLISWNDESGRTRAEVEELLIAAEGTVERELARSRDQLAAL